MQGALTRSLNANHAHNEEGAVQMDCPSSVTTSWASCLGRLSAVPGSTKPSMVEVAGIEPAS